MIRAAFFPSKGCLLALLVSALVLSTIALAKEVSPAGMRTWKAASGKFEIEAALVERNESEVKLQKKDGQIITVPLDKLSEADQEFLRSLTRPAAPAPRFARPADLKVASPGTFVPEQGTMLKLEPGPLPRGLAPDPLSYTKPLPEGGFELAPRADSSDKLSEPIILNGEKGVVAVAISRNVINKPEETRGRIFVGTLPKGPAKLAWDAPAALDLLDYDAASDRALLVSGLDHFGRGGDAVLIEGLAKGEAKELYRRPLAGQEKPGFKPKVDWGGLLDAEHAIVLLNDKLLVWNMASAELVYGIEKITPGCRPALSYNKRYLAVPMSGGAAVVNVVDGAALGFLPGADLSTPDVAFHPDGKQVVLVVGNLLFLYDLEAGQELSQAVLPNHISGRPVGWMGKNYLLASGGSLVRTDLGLPVWNYQLASKAPCSAPGGIVLAEGDKVCKVVSVRVPHRAAQAAAGQFAERGGDALMAVRAGSPVSLHVEAIAGVDSKEVEKLLRETIERTGWKVVPKSDTVVAAMIGRGATQSIEYRTWGPGVNAASAPTQTASITPFTAKLEVRRGGQPIWSRETKNYPPGFVSMKQGETLQDAVKQYEKPDPEFFGKLKLPPRIPSKELTFGMGFSGLKDFEWKDTPYVAKGAKKK